MQKEIGLGRGLITKECLFCFSYPGTNILFKILSQYFREKSKYLKFKKSDTKFQKNEFKKAISFTFAVIFNFLKKD